MMYQVSEIIFYRNTDNKLNRPTIDKTQRVSLFRTQTALDPAPSQAAYMFSWRHLALKRKLS